MNGIIISYKNSLKNSIRSKPVIAALLMINILILGIGLFFGIKYLLIPYIEKNDFETVKRYYNIFLFGISFVSFGLCVDMFAGSAIMKEKSAGIYESLLATPVSVKQLWMSKVLSAFMPSFLFAEFCTLASYFLVQYILVNPVFGNILTMWDFLSIFLIIPLIYFMVISLAFITGLNSSPIAGNAIVQIFLPVFCQLSINLGARSVVGATPLNFLLYNSGFALIAIILVIIFLPKLKKENVILSSRR
jgi:hypothetical protein